LVTGIYESILHDLLKNPLAGCACRSSAQQEQRQQQEPGHRQQQHHKKHLLLQQHDEQQHQHQQDQNDQQQRPDSPSHSRGAAAQLPALQCLTRWQLQLGHVLGQGATGDVVQGMWRGRPAAIKMVDTRCWQPASAFMWEAKVLRRLQPLQGLYVPALWAHGYVGSEDSYFMAMTLVHGTPLSKLSKPLPEAVQAAALHTLRHVHSLGVLHGDLRLGHLLLAGPSGAAPAGDAIGGGASVRVFLIDFDQASLDAPKEQLQAEEAELQELLSLG
jgi:predicted Ser/Thr protein kinase